MEPFVRFQVKETKGPCFIREESEAPRGTLAGEVAGTGVQTEWRPAGAGAIAVLSRSELARLLCEVILGGRGRPREQARQRRGAAPPPSLAASPLPHLHRPRPCLPPHRPRGPERVFCHPGCAACAPCSPTPSGSPWWPAPASPSTSPPRSRSPGPACRCTTACTTSRTVSTSSPPPSPLWPGHLLRPLPSLWVPRG